MGQNYLAIDFGGSSGRGILGEFSGERLHLTEIHRFPNDYMRLGNEDIWNIPWLYQQMVHALKRGMSEAGEICSLAVNTWGTDYGFTDRNGNLLGQVRCTRNSRGTGMGAVQAQVDSRRLFRRTGTQSLPGNTLYQLMERKLEQDPVLENARYLLMLPDLFAFFLTGVPRWEYTAAATSMMLELETRRWDRELLGRLGFKRELLGKIVLPGEEKSPVRRDLCREVGSPAVYCVTAAGHDTASAIAAAPLKPGEAFLSSGTWSLLGVELCAPLLTDEVYEANIANEGLADGGCRLTCNRMGMWAVRQCMKDWQGEAARTDWDSLLQQVKKEKPFRTLINLEEPQFYQGGSMKQKMEDYCKKTDQPIPESMPQALRALYESMACAYRMAAEQLERVIHEKISGLCIVGGGSRNWLLNQFTADALKLPVHTGPEEAASAGNVLIQAMAMKELSGTGQIREVVRRSFGEQDFYPSGAKEWEAAYACYLELVRKKL